MATQTLRSGRAPRLSAVVRTPEGAIGLVLAAVLVAVAVLHRWIAPGYEFATSPAALDPPSRHHLMGTDQLGRDLFTSVVRGANSSLLLVIGVVAIAGLVGLAAGAFAGLRGGVVDDIVMRVVETVQTIPRFFLAVLVVGWFGPERGTLTVLLGLTSWPLLARVVRAETLSLREREFIAAARSHGASDLRILWRHVVPNVLPAATVVLALIGSRIVLLEAGLAFLGLSDPNVVSWGSLVNNAHPYLERAWWMSVFPGTAIAATVLSLNLVADGLNRALRGAVPESGAGVVLTEA